jgi:hypothetical protein
MIVPRNMIVPRTLKRKKQEKVHPRGLGWKQNIYTLQNIAENFDAKM